MPRKEGPPLEERIQRAKELFEFKERQKAKNLQDLYASRIYRFARKISITFLWVAQLILIDWILPYTQEQDKILGSNVNTVIRPNKELFFQTANGYQIEVEFPLDAQRPGAGDSMIIYKSLLFHDLKKIYVPSVQEKFLITTAITYRFLPLLFIIATLALTFVFIKGIEVKVFPWIVAIFTTAGSIFFIYYLVAAFL